MNSVPSDTAGAAFFAPKPRPKWPTNINCLLEPNDKLIRLMALTGAEALATSLIVWLSSTVLTAYLTDWIGFAVAPSAVLAGSLLSAVAAWLWLRRGATSDRSALAGFIVTMSGTFAVLMWRARPD